MLKVKENVSYGNEYIICQNINQVGFHMFDTEFLIFLVYRNEGTLTSFIAASSLYICGLGLFHYWKSNFLCKVC